MSDASESNISSPVSRGPSPDLGFVLVDDSHSDDQETGALAKVQLLAGQGHPVCVSHKDPYSKTQPAVRCQPDTACCVVA